MSVVNMVLDGNSDIQEKFFEKLDTLKINPQTTQEIKNSYVAIKMDVTATILKEVSKKITAHSQSG